MTNILRCYHRWQTPPASAGERKKIKIFNHDANMPMFVKITNGQLVRHIYYSVNDKGLFIDNGLISQSHITVAGRTNLFAQGSYTFRPPNSAGGIYIG